MGISVQSSGIAVEKSKFYLVNLNADPSMNELLVYYLQVTADAVVGIALLCKTTNVPGHLCIIFLLHPIKRGRHLSPLSSWRMEPSIPVLQGTWSFAATAVSIHVLNPRDVLSSC